LLLNFFSCPVLLCFTGTASGLVRMSSHACDTAPGRFPTDLFTQNSSSFSFDSQNNKVKCTGVSCLSSGDCPRPVTQEGSCCPRCSGCRYQDRFYQNYQAWTTSDGCERCICNVSVIFVVVRSCFEELWIISDLRPGLWSRNSNFRRLRLQFQSSKFFGTGSNI